MIYEPLNYLHQLLPFQLPIVLKNPTDLNVDMNRSSDGKKKFSVPASSPDITLAGQWIIRSKNKARKRRPRNVSRS